MFLACFPGVRRSFPGLLTGMDTAGRRQRSSLSLTGARLEPMMSDEQSRDRTRPDADPGGARAAGTTGSTGPARQGLPAAAAASDPPATGPDHVVASAVPAADAARRKPGRRSFWRELPVLVLVALVIALLIKTFVVQAFYIPSSSMEDTLRIGDKVLVNKVIYHFRSIKAGDVVVFNGVGSWDAAPAPQPGTNLVSRLYNDTLGPMLHSIAGLFGAPPGQTDYIKRVIGVAGNRVACCNARGQVTVDGVALREQSYLYPGNAPSDIRFSIRVPQGRLWVMGDHRGVSDDSRLHNADPGAGTIPVSKVIGRAALIVWPPSRWRVLPIPGTFAQPGNAAAASPASGRMTAGSAAPATALAGGVPVAVSAPAPYLPLAAGLAGAVPLTLLQRRIRLRVRPRRGCRPSRGRR